MSKNVAASRIIEALGRKHIEARLAVSQQSVSSGKAGMPARWFPVIRDMCEDAGIDCPLDAFNWAKGAEAAQ